MIRLKLFYFQITFMVLVLTTSSSHSHVENSAKHHGDNEAPHWRAPESATHMMNPISEKEAAVQNGKKLFEQNWSGCHGYGDDEKDDIVADNDSSDRIPPHVTLLGGHHADGEIAWKIQKGRGDMPSWEKKLSENQIWELVSYLQSL